MSGPAKTSAVVIGASGGIGGAFEAALIDEGAFDVVHGFARSRPGARHIDLLDETSIAAAAAHAAKGRPACSTRRTAARKKPCAISTRTGSRGSMR
jgi:NAD(P)-dependent dehydrogenase (short-subunit alcohol dehydrogenase family)